MPAARPIRDRIEEKVSLGANGCWMWTGAIRADTGYGAIGLGRKVVQAHRAAYEVYRGPIPPGLHIDHLCGVRRCVNPRHLEAVTQAENNRRAGLVRRNNQLACKWGHLFDDANTMWSRRGHRQCRTCHNLRGKALRSGIPFAVLVEGGAR